mmetsp:Transcript_57805/g.163103  ORF Transcript_57805/g.163103 Transcript_57805/m.163103 type:complete len:310 (+) Transcript_57805:681-1610(+)
MRQGDGPPARAVARARGGCQGPAAASTGRGLPASAGGVLPERGPARVAGTAAGGGRFRGAAAGRGLRRSGWRAGDDRGDATSAAEPGRRHRCAATGRAAAVAPGAGRGGCDRGVGQPADAGRASAAGAGRGGRGLVGPAAGRGTRSTAGAAGSGRGGRGAALPGPECCSGGPASDECEAGCPAGGGRAAAGAHGGGQGQLWGRSTARSHGWSSAAAEGHASPGISWWAAGASAADGRPRDHATANGKRRPCNGGACPVAGQRGDRHRSGGVAAAAGVLQGGAALRLGVGLLRVGGGTPFSPNGTCILWR